MNNNLIFENIGKVAKEAEIKVTHLIAKGKKGILLKEEMKGLGLCIKLKAVRQFHNSEEE